MIMFGDLWVIGTSTYRKMRMWQAKRSAMPVAVDRQSRTANAFQDNAQWTIGQHIAQATLFQTDSNHSHHSHSQPAISKHEGSTGFTARFGTN
jgi:hypothetical protein